MCVCLCVCVCVLWGVNVGQLIILFSFILHTWGLVCPVWLKCCVMIVWSRETYSPYIGWPTSCLGKHTRYMIYPCHVSSVHVNSNTTTQQSYYNTTWTQFIQLSIRDMSEVYLDAPCRTVQLPVLRILAEEVLVCSSATTVNISHVECRRKHIQK